MSLIGAHGFKIANLSQHLMNDGQTFECRMIIKGRNRRNTEKLSRHLRGVKEILEFRIVPVNERRRDCIPTSLTVEVRP